MGETRMQIAELARRAGVTTATLRYYEEQGLVEPATRTEAGYRVYRGESLHRVRFIKRAQAVGLTLREIRQLVRDPGNPDTDLPRLKDAIAHKLSSTRRRIAELLVLERELEALDDHLSRGKPWCGRIGDCECWLPTGEEVRLMLSETTTTTTDTCPCPSDCDCSECDCGCATSTAKA